MKQILIFFTTITILVSNSMAQTVTDIDGNVYNTVTIGTQIWMKENLRVTRYNNGMTVPNVINPTAWTNIASGARCYYNNDSVVYAPVYGALYNWAAANDPGGICPAGWHVPGEHEWNIMEKYLDSAVDTTATGLSGTDIGGKLKEAGTAHWTSPNTGAVNSSGFSAIPGGYRYIYASYTDIGNYGYWWTADEYDVSGAWDRLLSYDNTQIYRYYHDKMLSGFSIRCICNKESGTTEMDTPESVIVTPNPAHHRISVACPDKQKMHLRVYNMIGECVLETMLIDGKGDVAVNSLSKGVYIIRLVGDSKTSQMKLIKE
ncbi:MAG TPA: FISUMP domain-containing protein [Bacteroidales bacterium]|nr:FISUMP domain-containing protein [Bacteroidales bacterium]